IQEAKHSMSQADNPLPAPVSNPAATSPSEVLPTQSGLPSGETAVSRPCGRTWMMVLAGGLLAGLAGFGFGEFAPQLVPPSYDLPREIRGDRYRVLSEHARRLRESQ